MNSILLIIPCFNEAQRLNLSTFLHFQNSTKLKISFLFANDGSRDQTESFIRLFIKDQNLQNSWHLFNNPINTGKANAISNAYNWSKTNVHETFDWYGFWDADLATPLFEIQNLITYRNTFYPEKEAIFSSRILRLGSQIIRNPLRHYLGRFFATVIYLILKVGSYDSQCGAKLISKNVSDQAFKEPFISPWIFDIEIMLRINEKTIVEYPLTQWEDVPGSKIKIIRECIRILIDIVKIKRTYLLKSPNR